MNWIWLTIYIMPVVSNTSPVLNLAIVGHLFLLRQQFGEVLIPEAVERELRLDTPWKGVAEVKASLSEGWLRVERVRNSAFVLALQRELDEGESEAIVLATERSLFPVILDEREARRVARRLEISVTGVLGVIIRAKMDGKIPAARELISSLRQEAGFWISAEIEAELLRQVGESGH